MLDAANNAGVNLPSFIRNAISMAVLRGGEAKFSEVTVSPQNNSFIDQWMEWLCSRKPTVSDLVGSGGELQPKLKIALYAELPSVQARRFEKVLCGLRMEVIGHEEGCSRQAVHASIKRAIQHLQSSHNFAKALCDAMPEAGIEPFMLIEAINNAQK